MDQDQEAKNIDAKLIEQAEFLKKHGPIKRLFEKAGFKRSASPVKEKKLPLSEEENKKILTREY